MRWIVFLLAFFGACAAFAQSDAYSSREAAMQALRSDDADRRAGALAWIAEHGTQADGEILERRLADADPHIRDVAEQGLWRLWSRSGDDAIDALLAAGVAEMQAGDYERAIATFSDVIRRKPAFAEGWNQRATALFLAGELTKSLADCDEVMKRNPHHFGALAGYGQIYFRQQRYEKAIEYWTRALDVNPNLEGLEVNIELAKRLLAERQGRTV
jgi:tetratricopeptide (TPR) repeat protein